MSKAKQLWGELSQDEMERLAKDGSRAILQQVLDQAYAAVAAGKTVKLMCDDQVVGYLSRHGWVSSERLNRTLESEANGVLFGCPYCGLRHPPDGMCV
jgi:hypothetical protein